MLCCCLRSADSSFWRRTVNDEESKLCARRRLVLLMIWFWSHLFCFFIVWWEKISKKYSLVLDKQIKSYIFENLFLNWFSLRKFSRKRKYNLKFWKLLLTFGLRESKFGALLKGRNQTKNYCSLIKWVHLTSQLLNGFNKKRLTPRLQNN